MTHGSLFSGIGGFDLAAEWMKWQNIFHCEKDNWCRNFLQKKWPNAKSYGDIKATDFSIYDGKLFILSGGDPCQPSSLSGKRKGKEDDRYLWPEYYRCAAECNPRYIVNENVEGSISNGILDQKISDLEAIGYACWPPFVIPAGAFGALHRRNRVWLVANSTGHGLQKFEYAAIGSKKEERPAHEYSSIYEAKWSKGENKQSLIRLANGLPGELDRNRKIKAYGNAIVPHVAHQIFKAIEQYELTV